MSPHVQADLAIVGAGPAGLYAAYYAGFRGLSVAVIDSLPEPGGQISALYPEKPIYDVAGFPAVRGRDLVDSLVEQSAPFSPTYLLGRQVVGLDRSPHPHHGARGIALTTADGRTVSCGAVVLTAGIGTFRPRPLPAGEAHLGRGLMYFVPTLAELADRDVTVVGGGDSALDWALALEPVARSVTLVHRRDSFRAHRHTVDQLLASSVRVLTKRQVRALHGADQVEAVEVRSDEDGTVESHAAQAVVAALGFTADLGPMTTWGLTLENRNIVVDTAMSTGLPGIYAAGDVTAYPGKVRLISVGFGEAATAVNNAATYLDPEADLFPGHSTETAGSAAPTPAPG